MSWIDLNNLLTFFNQDMGFTLSVAIGIITTTVALGLVLVFKKMRNPLRRRINSVTHESQTSGNKKPKVESKLQDHNSLGNKAENSELHQQFVYAGYSDDRVVSAYYITKIGLTLCMPLVAYLAALFLPSLSSKHAFLLVVVVGVFGFLAPGMYLDYRIKKRQSAILNGFPDMLDLLVACSEAGLGLNAALQRVADEISLSYPELAHEMQTVNLEMRAGVDRMESLKGLATRTGLEEVSGLVSMLRQSIRFGSGISETLRIYAEEFRDRRMQKAEAVAGSIGTKMIFPLILCIFPAFFVVAIGPAVINIIEVLGSG